MPLPAGESELLQCLQRGGVVEQADLAERLHLSAKTLQRRLRDVACYRSLNCNAAFLTLAATPRFDDRGLWTSGGVCFSRHGDLSATLRCLIADSPNGQTRQELQGLVHTSVHNHLSLLLRRRAIASFVLGRLTVYTSADPLRRQQQQTARRPPPPGLANPALLPPGLDPVVVVRVLVRLLQTPDASTASLAKSLQAQRLGVTAEQVRQVTDFYALKKTTR